MYQTVPINIAGPSYQSRSLPLSAQQSVNMYQEINEGAKSPNIMQPFPGLKLFNAQGGIERNSTVMGGIIYRVAGTTLYKVSSGGTHTSLGTITGNNRCIFANDGTNLFIVSGSTVYQWNGTTLSQVSDPDIQGATSVGYQNRQFLYSKDNNFVVSDVGDGSSADALNAAQAESQPDDLVRVYIFKDDAYMFGTESVEPFFNTGTGSPPYDRITGQIVSVGTNAIHSIAHNDNYFYFLGDDNFVYQCVQGIFNPISSNALTHAIEGYATSSDAIGHTISFENQKFYLLTFPSANKTWVLNENLGKDGWFELSSDTNQGRYQCTSFVRVYNKNIAFDDSGAYELDTNTYDNNGEIIQRVRTIGGLNGTLLGKTGARVQMSKLRLELHTGGGLITGQGSNPKVMVEYSTDGGRSFGNGTWAKVGRQGQNIIKVEWHSYITFYDLILRLTITDPVYCSIYSGGLDVRFAGW